MGVRGPFRTLMQEYGSTQASVSRPHRLTQTSEKRMTTLSSQQTESKTEDTAVQSMELEEERESGSVAFGTYAWWLGNMGSFIWPLLLGVAYVISTGVSIANILWLAYWQQDEFDGLSQGAYQGIYAGASCLLNLYYSLVYCRLMPRYRSCVCCYWSAYSVHVTT
jgi:hypothetical protein